MGKTKVSKQRLIDTLRESKGAVSIAAKRLGIDRTTIYNYIKRWPEAAAVLDEVRDEVCDLAELKLYAMINNDDHKDQLKAIQYQLDTHGRRRGWGAPITTKVEVSGDVNTTNKVDVTKLSDEVLRALAQAKRDV